MNAKKRSPIPQWEQEMIEAYYDDQWHHQVLDPLYDKFQHMKKKWEDVTLTDFGLYQSNMSSANGNRGA